MGNPGIVLAQLIQIYSYLVILDIILSWVLMASNHSAIFTVKRFLDRIVEPALYPIRQALRPYTRDLPFDFSPIVLLLLLNVLQILVVRIFSRF